MDNMIVMQCDAEECALLIAALNSYLRRMTRDYRHKARQAELAARSGEEQMAEEVLLPRLQQREVRMADVEALRDKLREVLYG